jgi:hypothetical protein
MEHFALRINYILRVFLISFLVVQDFSRRACSEWLPFLLPLEVLVSYTSLVHLVFVGRSAHCHV